ncbi:MAG: cytochrome c biogenesis protein ResB [Egibacteraceae bacterium]
MTDTLPRPERTEPGPGGQRLPDIPGPVETAVRAWRRLRRMSTALVLLFALAAAAVVATFVPQEPVIARTVFEWRAGVAGPGEGWARLFDWLSLFDVFGSWWFMTLAALLFISLTGCLLPRWAAFAKVAPRPPQAGRNLGRLGHHVVIETVLDPDEALAAAEKALRGWRRRRVESADGVPQLAAERGHWREGGSLVFHTAFYLLLIGIVIGHSFGWTGQVNVVEGEAFTDTTLGYQAQVPGRFWSAGNHRGFTLRLDDFDVSYHDNFVPADFVSTVTIMQGDKALVSGAPIRVNHPLTYEGMKIYQARFGYAPEIVMRTSAGTELFRAPVILVQSGPLWVGREKVAPGNPATGAPQIAVELALIPDGRIVDGELRINSPEPRNPRVVVTLYSGDLGLERPVPLASLPWSEDQIVGQAMLAPGGTAEMLRGNLIVEFAGLPTWSGFQVSHAPGRGILLAAAVLILVGLLPSLYSYRRRIWVQARRRDGGTEVVLAGVALQRKPAFADEFERILQRLTTAVKS